MAAHSSFIQHVVDHVHILRCEGTKPGKDLILDKLFRNMDAQIGIRRIVRCKNKEQWQKLRY
jgi:hypothetical protein